MLYVFFKWENSKQPTKENASHSLVVSKIFSKTKKSSLEQGHYFLVPHHKPLWCAYLAQRMKFWRSPGQCCPVLHFNIMPVNGTAKEEKQTLGRMDCVGSPTAEERLVQHVPLKLLALALLGRRSSTVCCLKLARFFLFGFGFLSKRETASTFCVEQWGNGSIASSSSERDVIPKTSAADLGKKQENMLYSVSQLCSNSTGFFKTLV